MEKYFYSRLENGQVRFFDERHNSVEYRLMSEEDLNFFLSLKEIEGYNVIHEKNITQTNNVIPFPRKYCRK